MEEQQTAQPQQPAQPQIQPPTEPPVQPPVQQPPVIPTPKKFPWRRLILILLVLLLLSGGVCAVLAWRTTYLDRWLPQNIKEMFGRGEMPGEQPGEPEEKAPYTGKLAFLQEGEVWVIKPDGTGKEKITNTGGKIKVFHFSPNGKSLAYILQKKFKKEEWPELIGYKLVLLDPLTGKAETIVKSLPEEYIRDYPPDESGLDRELNSFAFSHDGTQVVYAREGVWVLDLSTRKAAQIKENPEKTDTVYYSVSWSPGDTRILAQKVHYEGASWEIFDPDGSNPQDLGFVYMGGTSTEGFIDDNSLLQSGFDDEGEEVLGHIFWVSLTDPQKKNTILKAKWPFHPVHYSQALEKVIFSVNEYSILIEEPQNTFQPGQLYTIGLDGEGLSSLTSEPLEGFLGGVVVSPSGKIGIIVENLEQQLDELWIVDPTTKDQRKLTQVVRDDETDEATQIEWSPD